MFLINSVNKLCKTTKIINAFSKGYVRRSLFLCSCQAQNKVELKSDKITQKPNKPPPLQSESKDDFIKIYRNNVIFFGGIINRLKWYQTLMTVGTVPVSMALLLSGTITENLAVLTVLISATITAMLYANGFLFFRRTIGLIYLSKDNKTVKIGYLGFWGEKEEEEYSIEEVVPFNELPETFTSRVFKTVNFDTDKYRLYLHFGGQILDENRFATVFGDIE